MPNLHESARAYVERQLAGTAAVVTELDRAMLNARVRTQNFGLSLKGLPLGKTQVVYLDISGKGVKVVPLSPVFDTDAQVCVFLDAFKG